jgi:hypothetical protein
MLRSEHENDPPDPNPTTPADNDHPSPTETPFVAPELEEIGKTAPKTGETRDDG